ncbi:MAG TPA: hypothetical protein VKA84_22765 [Gemmatimonadaceae bacterium]|nr:hypothetical protein [Gemmatimonadaceae bacterium]
MLLALFRFHAAAGARAALRNAALGFSIVVFVAGMSPDPLYVLWRFSLGVAAAGEGSGARVLLGLVMLGLATQAVPKLVLRLGGWMRSLPADGVTHRRAVTLALLVPQAPALAVAVLCALLTATVYDAALSASKLLALPAMMLGVAAAAAPARRHPPAAALPLAAAYLAALGGWLALAAALALLALHDRVAGALASAPPRQAHALRDARRLLPLRIAYRAMRWRVLGVLPVAALPIAASYFWRTNNRLTPDEAAFAARWGALLAAAFAVGVLANVLVVSRPVWAWERSLAQSSVQRVAVDAAALALPALPALAAASAVLDWRGALLAMAALPLFGALAASAIRRAHGRVTGASGEALVLGVPAALAVAWWPWLAAAALALAPLSVLHGARRERRRRVSAWGELHHDSAGDPLSWGAR